ncbi:MAG: hypothetical protein JW829_06600 [Pirellulales bacterium]|nr:hypothetical protein [Pirellulales bacterium]
MFVFALHPEVEAANNRSKRLVRPETIAWNASRTSKSDSGAMRRGIMMSVLSSLVLPVGATSYRVGFALTRNDKPFTAH